jgi:tight adherence protein C
MTRMLLPAAGAMALLIMAAGVAMLMQMRRDSRIAARIRMLHGEPVHRPVTSRAAIGASTLRAIATIGQWIVKRGLLPAGTLGELRRTLSTSGLSEPNGLGLFIGGKIMLAAGLPIVTLLGLPDGLLSPLLSGLVPAVAAVLGLVTPDYLLGAKRKAHLKRLEAGLPDALDVMVICTQAGIGLGSAIVMVSTELADAHPAISREFAQTANELGMIAESRVALINLGTRTGLDSFKRLSATLVQTQQYGTPITDALRILSAEMRRERLTRFEASAARLGVLLTLPTLVFIMPCVFLVVGGPAAIQLIRTLGPH